VWPDQGTRRFLLWPSGVSLAAGLVLDLTHAVPLVTRLLLGVSLAVGICLTLRKAWHSFRGLTPDINVLMLEAASGVVILNQWTEAETVVFLLALAQALDALTLDRARTAIAALMELTPTQALIRDDSGEEQHVGVDTVQPGAVIIVRPVEK